MADLIDRTAVQVRLPGGVVHKRKGSSFDPAHGRRYRTVCGSTLPAEHGAMLTTRPVDCDACEPRACKPSASVEERTREFVEAVLGDSHG